MDALVEYRPSVEIVPRNALLRAMAPEDFLRLRPHLEPVQLRQGEILATPSEQIQYAYFFEDGLSSEIAINPQGEKIEVGCVGYEGMTPVAVLYGVDQSPGQSLMQSSGSAWRIPTAVLQNAMDKSPALRGLLLRFAHVMAIQAAQAALSSGRYELSHRLSGWLLKCQDRLGDKIDITHDSLALILGVRRAGITTALHVLEGDLAVRSDRGRITVRNRETLMKGAGGCYGVPEAEYRRLID
jgi:CRP-like cAMP-binding protein